MKTQTKNMMLLASAAFFVMAGSSSIATAKETKTTKTTTTTQTVVSQKELPNVEKTDFSSFDVDGDGTLSMEEVGEKLFYIFDTDGNETIDNIEFNNKQVMTIIPMEKETLTLIDREGDGTTDRSTYEYETFIKQSQLMRFDQDMDGLSPADFIEMSFLELDDNKSKTIELDEWKEEYMEKTIPATAEQERYN